jgi:hypothetical protein
VKSRCRPAGEDNIQMVFKALRCEHVVSVHLAQETVRLGET